MVRYGGMRYARVGEANAVRDVEHERQDDDGHEADSGQRWSAQAAGAVGAAGIVGNVRQVELEEGDDQEREPEQREGVHRDLGPICASARRQCCGPQSD